MSRATISIALLAAAATTACGSRMLVPPRLDLAELYRVGLVTFTMENAKGDLNVLATERFAGEVFAAQGGVEVLELGTADQVLAEIGEERLGPRAARAIGDEYELAAFFVGQIRASNVKPRASLIRFPSLEAVVDVQMTVRLISAESGATMWSNSARATETVGGLSLIDDEVVFGASDPNEAYGHLVEHLVYELTRDLRPTYR